MLDDLGLRMSSKGAKELSTHFGMHRVPPALGMAGDLARRMCDELELNYYLALSLSERDLYEQISPLFGDEVEASFPIASEDISEAGKCIALGRYTASIFHLMRAMEAALTVLGNKLRVTVVDKNNADLEWGKILSNLAAPIEKMPRGDSRQQWSSAFSLLLHTKTAWRNPTMHPKQTYTEDQAKDILATTRSFINSLSALI